MKLNIQVSSSNPFNFVFDGNSLTWQHGQYFSLKVKEILTDKGFDLSVSSFGVSGQRLLQMVNNSQTKIFPLVDSQKINVLIINEDANGILQDGYTAEYNLQLMNQYINLARANGYNYVITWNGWNLRKEYDIFIPTESAVNQQIIYFDLANTTALTSDLNIDMRNALHVGGGVGLYKDSLKDLDYIHRTIFSYDFGISPYFCEQLETILN